MLENPLKQVLVKSAILGSEDRQYLRDLQSAAETRDAILKKLTDEQKLAIRRFEDTGEGFAPYMVEPLEAKRFTSPAAEIAYQKAVKASKPQAIQKLIQFAKTGQNGQYWMNDHFLKGYGVSMEDLKKPSVQKAILAAVDKNDLSELRYALPDKVLPTNKAYQHDGLLEALAEGIKGGKFTDQSDINNQKATVATQAAPASAPTSATTPLQNTLKVTNNLAPIETGATVTTTAFSPDQLDPSSPHYLSSVLNYNKSDTTNDSKPAPVTTGQAPVANTAETSAAEQPPAEQPAQVKKPAGLTREETMQFLEQGYVPTSNGGFMLHEQRAADTLKAMQQNPNLNPGAVITNADKLNRIRTNMLGNAQHTAQGRQQIADDMVYQKAMYHKNRQAEIDSGNNAALEQYRGKLTEDARTNYLRRGELDYQRSVANGTPLTPEAQYYQAYSNAEIDGNPAPPLPSQVQQTISQGMQKFKGQLAARQKPTATAVNPRHSNYMTQQEMAAYAKAHAANNSGQSAVNTLNSWDPNRLKEAQERYNNATSGNVQATNPVTASTTTQPVRANTVAKQPAATTAPAGSTTTTSMGKTASIRKPLINPFLK